MGIVIISILLCIGTIIGLIICKQGRYSALGVLWLLLILFGCFTKIGANTIGIFYNPFKGGIQEEVLGEGFKTKSPFDKVYKISTEVKEFVYEDISVQTNDSQFVKSEIQVQVRINKENAFLYFKKYGSKSLGDISNIISNTIQKELEEVTTKYNIMEVLGKKRNDIVNATLEQCKDELSKDGITIERIVLIDTDAGDDVEKAIANEAIKKKEAETALYEKQRIETEGEAKVIQAQKEKEANDLLRQTLTEAILKQKMIEKWNGALPNTVLNNDIMSMFNIAN